MKAYRSLEKGRMGYLTSVVASSSLTMGVHDIPAVREYQDVFPEELPGVPSHIEVEFLIDLVPVFGSISKALYRMALAGLRVLRKQL